MMFEAWDENVQQEQQEQEGEQDHASFDDSDRFEDESICSFETESSSNNNWQGWKKPPPATGSGPSPQPLRTLMSISDEGELPSLVELASRQVARRVPFELVDRHNPPVPEQLQKRIAFWSFPDSEEDIRLYCCLSTGNAEEFLKGETLYRQKLVKNLLQIGLHLNASVVPPAVNGAGAAAFNVAITFDRNRITSCSCTCDKADVATWCSHIVAVCLQRLHQAQSSTIRAPLSESLSRLDKNQLWKFAQYFLHELPRQALPTAQKLLDELLQPSSAMNVTDGAPDPTAECSLNEMSSWCLNESLLRENIRNLLVKFCIPSPTVCSDVNYLSATAPPAAAEWSNLLRPLRGKEPEGMWNLLSIIKEMFRKADNNAVDLLTIITNECLACEQIVVWWYSTKVSHGSTNVASPPLGRVGTGVSNATPQHASASLMDEIVAFWKLAALNPANSDEDRTSLRQQFESYHNQVIEKVKKSKNQNAHGQNVAGNPGGLRPSDLAHFAGFKPAMEMCLLNWKNYPVDGITVVASSSIHHSKFASGKINAEGNEAGGSWPQIQGTHCISLKESNKTDARETPDEAFVQEGLKSDSDCDSIDEVEPSTRCTSEPATSADNVDKFEMLFVRAEALLVHGYIEAAHKLAVQLADGLLRSPPDFLKLEQSLLQSTSTTKKRVAHKITAMCEATMVKLIFLTNVLSDKAETRNLAFRIGLFGLEMARPPSISKAVEVKMFHQEIELVNLLKKVTLGPEELSVARQKARALRDGTLKSRGDALLPLNLATYIFGVFCGFDHEKENHRSAFKRKEHLDAELGFEAAVAALGMKNNVSEADHPLVCEGTRRQRSELACALLVTFKDDQAKLDRVMDHLLDKNVQQYRRASFETARENPLSFAQIKNMVDRSPQASSQEVHTYQTSSLPYGHHIDHFQAKFSGLRLKADNNNSEDSSTVEDDKLWENKLRCTVFKPRKKHGDGLPGGIDSSAPETTSSDNSPTMIRRFPRGKHVKESDSATSSGESSSTDSRGSSLKPEDEAIVPNMATPRAVPVFLESAPSTSKGGKGGKRKCPSEPNQPSEAISHFLFELAKTVLAKAGGNVNHSILFQPAWGQQQAGPHRALHMCAFQIGMSALGIHNCVSPNWQSRTYSSYVSWITSQAMEIGVSAVNFLVENWEGHLTPPEVAVLADKASRCADANMVSAAAQLALSILPHSHALNPLEIQRALVQCKEQSYAMLEQALTAVETCAKSGGVYPEALFDVSRKWYELYSETAGEPIPEQFEIGVWPNNNQPVPLLPLPPYGLPLLPQPYLPHPHHHPYLFNPMRNVNLPFHPFAHPYHYGQHNGLMGPAPGMVHPGAMMHLRHNQPAPVPILPSPYMVAAFRVGILAMDTLCRRVNDAPWRIKYDKSPPYGDFVKWLLGVSKKLERMQPGSNSNYYIETFCTVAHNAVASPYVLYELASDVAHFLPGDRQSNHVIQLLQKSLLMFRQCLQQKIHQISPGEYDDFAATVKAAHQVSVCISNGPVQFQSLLGDIKRNKSCKRELWNKLIEELGGSKNLPVLG